ncbi:MAG TPA: CHAD domain-containing protein, partial [Longimicrobium sp.]
PQRQLRKFASRVLRKRHDRLLDQAADPASLSMEERHRLRIEAKRLRYLLEPFADGDDDARALVKQLKKLQDLLGEMHDAHVARLLLDEERKSAGADTLPGLAALSEAAVRETERLYGDAEGGWLGGRADDFFGEVEALALRLRTGGAEDTEIERKFLLKGMPRLPKGAVRTDIAQGYLPGARLQERVRRVLRRGEAPRYYRTVKLGTGISRMEVEEEADEDTFRRLWRLTKGRRVRKRRYRVAEGGLTWEIDRFRGRDLVLAEVELPSEDHAVELPEWLRGHVVRDVTGEDAYVNVNLAG